MDHRGPSRQECQLLLHAYHYVKEHDGMFSDSSWLREQLKLNSNCHVWNLKQSLTKKGYLRKNDFGIISQTAASFEYLTNLVIYQMLML
jgi:hypothetical protein